MHKEIAESVKASLRNVADSFAGVLSFDVNPAFSEQENVHRIIQQTATVCAVVACVNPVPLTDFLLLTPIHAKMTFHIGKVKGFDITQERALDILREVLSTIGLSMTATWLASFIKPIPVVSFLIYAPIIYGATYGIGHVVEAYFHGLKTGQVPSAQELKAIYEKQLSRGKVEGASLRKEQLDRAYQEMKEKVEQREAKKEAEHADKDTKGHTPLGIRIKEKPVRRPAEKSMGEELPPPPPKEEEPAVFKAEKTMGPATPAAGVEIKATPVEKSLGPLPPPKAVEVVPVPAPSTDKTKLLDDLERLAKLKEIGALTPEEFELAKKKLLG
jgi:uncharacterized protein (DUF697 family)